MARRRTITMFVGLGLVLTLGIAFFASPYASSEPDGLERVSIEKGFDETATDHALAEGPLADYAVSGVQDEKLSTGLAGILGVALCFAIGAGIFLVIRAVRSRQGPAPSTTPG